MIFDRPNGGEEPVREAEWTWVADAYQKTPAPRPEAVENVIAMAVAAVVTRRRSLVGQQLPWMLGTAAILAFAVFAWRRVGLPQPTPLAGAGPRSGPALSMAPDREPPLSEPAPPSAPATESDTMPAVLSTSPRAPVHTPAPPPTDVASSTTNLQGDSAKSIDSTPAAPVALSIAGVRADALARLRAGLGDEGLYKLAALLRSAAGDNLPPTPLLDRALAGLVHDASPSVVLEAVGQRAATLRQARNVLGIDAPADELTAGADALESGAGTPQLAEIRRHFPRGRATAGLLVLAGFMADGVPASAAVEALARGADAGVSDATLLSWRAGVMADVARGVAPLAALQAQVESLGDRGVPDRNTPRPGLDPDLVPTPSRHSSPVDLR